MQAACDQLAAERTVLTDQADELEAAAAAAAGESAAQGPDAARAAAALENVRQPDKRSRKLGTCNRANHI